MNDLVSCPQHVERDTVAHLDRSLQQIDDLVAGDYRQRQDDICAAMSALTEDHLLLRGFALKTARGELPVRLSSAQSFMLFSGRFCSLRLNCWYPRSVVAGSAEIEHSRYFSIDVCHNHGFDFFTTCVLGPGYTSRFLRTAQDVEHLEAGDTIDFQDAWTLRLGHGRTVFVPRGSDFHTQLYPDAFSATINLIPHAGYSTDGRQYILDDDHVTVKRVIVVGGEARMGRDH